MQAIYPTLIIVLVALKRSPLERGIVPPPRGATIEISSAQSRTAVDSSVVEKSNESGKKAGETLPSLSMIVGKHIHSGSGGDDDDKESEPSPVENV